MNNKNIGALPQFPKTNSFFFFNRTNRDLKLLVDRKNELEYYLDKVINMPRLRGSKFIRNLIKQGSQYNKNDRRRSISPPTQKGK